MRELSSSHLQPSGTVFYLLTVLLLLVGCTGIPNNAIKLSEIQIHHLEQYQKAIQSVIDSHLVDAAALIAERDQDYKRLIARCEDLRKELYRLTSHLLSRQLIPTQPLRFEDSLPETDREVIRTVEQHVNRRIERFVAASLPVQIENTALLKAKQDNNHNEIRRILDQIPARWVSLRRDIENLLMYEPFEEVHDLFVSRIHELNNKAGQENPDVGRLGNDVKLFITKIDDIETVLDDLCAAQVVYHEKAKQSLDAIEAQLTELESAGSIVVDTQRKLHGILHRIKTTDFQAVDILANISPVVDSLGTAGMITNEETNAITEIVNSIKNLLQNEET
jgi:hypothetical protein